MATLHGIDIHPGDVLLYSGKSLFAWAIRIKTFSPISHVEVVGTDGWFGPRTYASRPPTGVDSYTPAEQDLYAILRPMVPLTALEKTVMRRVHEAFVGFDYDWLGLLGFFLPVIGRDDHTRVFCSEHIARLFKLSGRPLFGVAYPSDKVSPGMFLACPLLETVWQETETP
jgi:hypothetical protein